MKTNNSIFDTFKEGFDAGFYKRLNGNSALDLYVGKTIVDSILLNTEVHLHPLRLNVQS